MRACKGNGTVLDECSRECTCVKGVMQNCYRIRKEFTSYTPEEKRRFLQAYLKITTEEPVKSKLAKFLRLHPKWFWKGKFFLFSFITPKSFEKHVFLSQETGYKKQNTEISLDLRNCATVKVQLMSPFSL